MDVIDSNTRVDVSPSLIAPFLRTGSTTKHEETYFCSTRYRHYFLDLYFFYLSSSSFLPSLFVAFNDEDTKVIVISFLLLFFHLFRIGDDFPIRFKHSNMSMSLR